MFSTTHKMCVNISNGFKRYLVGPSGKPSCYFDPRVDIYFRISFPLSGLSESRMHPVAPEGLILFQHLHNPEVMLPISKSWVAKLNIWGAQTAKEL